MLYNVLLYKLYQIYEYEKNMYIPKVEQRPFE